MSWHSSRLTPGTRSIANPLTKFTRSRLEQGHVTRSLYWFLYRHRCLGMNVLTISYRGTLDTFSSFSTLGDGGEVLNLPTLQSPGRRRRQK